MAYSPIFNTPTVQPGMLGLNRRQQQVQGVGDLLTSLGIGLMGNGPTTTPQGPLQGLGQGLAMNSQMQAQRQAQQSNDMRDQIAQGQYGMEQQKFNADQEYQKARSDQLEKAVANLPPDQQAAARADPESFWKAYADHMFAKQPTFKIGDTRTIQQGSNNVTQEYQQDGTWKNLGEGPKFAPPSQTNVNLPKTEDAFAKAFGGAEGDAAGKLANDVGTQAASQLQNLDALKQAVAQLQAAGGDTGKFAQLKLQATQIAQGLGMDPSKFGLPDNAGPGEVINSITNQLALQMRNPAGGAGMPGAMSDADRNYLSQTVPNIDNSPQGMGAKIDIASKVSQRNAEMSARWNAYPDQTQAGFKKFKREWKAYTDANPLFRMADRQKYNSGVTVGQPKAETTAPDQLNPADGWGH